MSFDHKQSYLVISFIFILLLSPGKAAAQEIFVYRPFLEKDPVSTSKKVTVHGDYFGYLIFPGNLPSYNDLSGEEARLNFGFQNILFLSNTTRFVGQLLTHDDGQRRTKFDWHFSLRQTLFQNLVLILGHDSNHDADYQSMLGQKKYFVNRNYVGVGLPFTAGRFFIEPFTWFFHHSNHRSHLDYSGDELRQEFGIRVGTWVEKRATVSFQWIAQSNGRFSYAQAYLVDLIVRIRLLNYLELSLGSRVWKDIQESPAGNKQSFYQIMWGIAVPF
jgi:hypothetical protein